MALPDWHRLFGELNRWRSLGERVLDDGTRLIGHIPHVAPEAWLHAIFAPLSDSELMVLEEQVGRRIPDSLQELFLQANGLALFSGSLSVYGLRRVNSRAGEAAWQPFSIHTLNSIERPRHAPATWIYLGSYGKDGSAVVLDAETERVYHCDRDSTMRKREWVSIHLFLQEEVDRLASLFDERGCLTMSNPRRLPTVARSAPPPA